MLVKDIIWKALVRLDVSDEYDKTNIDNISDKRLDDLLFSLNTIVKEITTDYLPLRATEQVKVVAGYISNQDFSKHYVAIKQIRRKGAAVYFKTNIENVRVFCNDGVVECDYEYSISDLGIDSQFSLSRRISEELIVFGLMGDYCLTKGMLESAMSYDRRYRDSLHLAMRDTASRHIAPRGWYD